MSSILSAISGQFSKALILGSLFPATVVLTLALIFLWPLFPADWPLQAPSVLSDPMNVVAFSFFAILIGFLLYTLNIPIVRLFEGYPWMNGPLGKKLIERHQARFEYLDARARGYRALFEDGRFTLPKTDPTYQAIYAQLNRTTFRVTRFYPGRKDLILPTRLGNTIRSFEDYPRRQYGMESITLWPRLVGKVSDSYAAVIDDAKSSFDFMLNSCLLLALLGAALLVTGLARPGAFHSWPFIAWLVEVIIAFGLSYLLYDLSIGRAISWGSTIKSAFDLYRWDLLTQLGYKQMPRSSADEQNTWSTISDQFLSGLTPGVPALAYDTTKVTPSFPSCAGKCVQPDAKARIELTRGVESAADGSSIGVIVLVRNRSAQDAIASFVLTDQVPDGFDYVWRSAQIDGDEAAVSGVNPYRFHGGPIPPEGYAVVRYRIRSRSASASESEVTLEVNESTL